MLDGRIHREVRPIRRASRHDQRADEGILHESLPDTEALEAELELTPPTKKVFALNIVP